MDNMKFGFAVLLGPPNAGKSTLMNTFLGQKVAIVSPKPQTTRNRISGILTTDEAQVVFLDTPGVHRLGGRMNRMLLDAAWGALANADVVVVMLDAALYAAKPHLFDKEIKPLTKPVDKAGRPVLIAVNKIDRIKDKAAMLPVLQKASELFPGAEIVPVSALRGQGTDVLLEQIVSRLPGGFPMYPEDQLSTMPLRFMAAETIREKVFLTLHQELPYSTAVEIEDWDEKSTPGTTIIHAVIYTAKKNHKGMIIGKGGQTLKAIGSQARMELNEMLDTRVHLELWVKVRARWTEDVSFMRTLGLGEE